MLTAVLTFATPGQAMQLYSQLVKIQEDYPSHILEVEVDFEQAEVLITAIPSVIESVVGKTQQPNQA